MQAPFFCTDRNQQLESHSDSHTDSRTAGHTLMASSHLLLSENTLFSLTSQGSQTFHWKVSGAPANATVDSPI